MSSFILVASPEIETKWSLSVFDIIIICKTFLEYIYSIWHFGWSGEHYYSINELVFI
jgi:hypothetical protein